MKRDLLGLAAIILLAVGAGCTTDPTESLSEGIGAVSTSVNYVEVVVGDSVAVTAETMDNQGVAIADPLPTAASQDPTILAVSDAYLPPLAQARFYIKALAFGEGEVVATAGSETATITVQTLPGSVQIGGAPDTLGSGNSVQLTAVPLDAAGGAITMDDTLFTWSASPASTITVDATGLATGMAPGAATVTVSGPGDVTATVDVVVAAGVFGGTLSASSAAPGTLVTATKAAAGPDFDADSKATLAGASAWIDAFTATTMTFAVPATGATTAATLTLSDMGASQIAQNVTFTPTSALDVWSPGNITDDCSDPTAPPDYAAEASANGWLYFSHNGTTQGGTGCQNGGSGFDHYFLYTTGGTAETREIRAEWKVDGDMDLIVCTTDYASCPATGFSGAARSEVIAAANLAANTTYYIIFSPWEAGAGSNSVRLRIQ
jgi:hypothetical protein